MDAQAKKKALYRAKLNAQKQKRIDSPLVRYNEHDQPVCKVCDVVLKSESLWPAHQASRKHHEAINNLKASAAALTQAKTVPSEPFKELPRPKTEHQEELHNHKPEPSEGLPKPRPSSGLPSDFFDNHGVKRQKNEMVQAKLEGPDLPINDLVSAQTEPVVPFALENKVDGYLNDRTVETRSETQPESKKVKGSLPEGFFDDKDADLRAHGITPVKPDVKDEYKEFEKLIQQDLKQVDDRFEEEEFDAAEMIEEAESVEQTAYRERVEILRKKKLELRAARTTVSNKGTEVLRRESAHEESSSDDDSDETLDWRAKHL